MLQRLIILIFLFLLLFGCNTVDDEINDLNPTPPDSTGFSSVTTAGVTLKYKVDSENLRCTLSANTNGWIAVGFDPENVMENSNLIIGYVNNNEGFIRDDWGVSATSHVSDESLGGTSDIVSIDASEENGTTSLEFTIPLNSGDQYDKSLSIGEDYQIILAQGDSDDFTSYHTAAGFTQITIIDNE